MIFDQLIGCLYLRRDRDLTQYPPQWFVRLRNSVGAPDHPTGPQKALTHTGREPSPTTENGLVEKTKRDAAVIYPSIPRIACVFVRLCQHCGKAIRIRFWRTKPGHLRLGLFLRMHLHLQIEPCLYTNHWRPSPPNRARLRDISCESCAPAVQMEAQLACSPSTGARYNKSGLVRKPSLVEGGFRLSVHSVTRQLPVSIMQLSP